MKKIIVIVGPTGVGKTKLSIELAKKYNAEIINADSMQVYEELNIGTAKIKEEEKEQVIHHLFDIKKIEEEYNVFNYQTDCRNKIEEILNKNKIVIIVGGTGLYIKAALYDYKFNKEEIKQDINLTNEELYSILKENNIEDIHINNRQRLIRAYQKSLNDSVNTNEGHIPLYDFDLIGLTTNRATLYENINNRVDAMFNEGLVKEAKQLYEKEPLSKALNTAIGYKEFKDYFNKTKNLEEIKALIKQNSRHYAKRQYTFFNNQMNVTWFETDFNMFSNTIKEINNYIQK